MFLDRFVYGYRWCSKKSLSGKILAESLLFPKHIHEGRAQQSLGLIAGMSSILGGMEVIYEHYRGSYGQKIMYSPVVLSFFAGAACLWGAFNAHIAQKVMPFFSSLLLVDGLIGFIYHIRGVARKPGGWRIPVFNIIMGPPLFAPLLLGIGGYLGVIASFMRREDKAGSHIKHLFRISKEIATGHFQKHMAIATSIAAVLSGAEALYSHYKNNFRFKWQQWSPLIIAPVLMTLSILSIINPKLTRKALPFVSILAIVDGTAGFLYHSRGVKNRPGGIKHLGYNILYGPPVFAPLLFAAAGFLGLLATMMRREDK